MRYTHTIDVAALRTVCPQLERWSDARVSELAKALGTAFERFQPGIGQWAMAYAIGQLAHESGEFRWSRELWGPTAVQRGYWRRRELQGTGPLWPGLGYATRGGGWIQTTGRNNFRAAAKRLGMRSYLTLAARSGRPSYASLLAAIWWTARFPRDMSDRAKWDVERVTRIVNGGTNGLDERRTYTRRAIAVRHKLTPKALK